MEKVERFLEDWVSDDSRPNYKSQLCGKTGFFTLINKDPETYATKDFRRVPRNEQIDLIDKYESDILAFAKKIKHMPPKTQTLKISIVKKYFEYLYVDFPTRFWNEIRKRNQIKQKPTRKKLSRTVEKTVFQTYKGKCAICGKKTAFDYGEVDHIRPIAKGGSPTAPSNLQWLCHRCNKLKGANRTNTQIKKLLGIKTKKTTTKKPSKKKKTTRKKKPRNPLDFDYSKIRLP